jgi:hypothetical protein
LTHETMVQNAFDDVSSTIHQSLIGGALEGAGVGVPRGVHGRLVQVETMMKPVLNATGSSA